MRRKLEAEVTAGIFLFIGLTAAMLTIFMMGGGQKLFEKTYQIQTEVSDVAGLAKGAVVRSGGVKIGYVENISFSDSYDSVKVVLTINESYRQRVREDSVVRFQTQGVLGDKYLEIAGGSRKGPRSRPVARSPWNTGRTSAPCSPKGPAPWASSRTTWPTSRCSPRRSPRRTRWTPS